MKTGLSSFFRITLTPISLIGQAAQVVESMYLNVFIYKMFRATAGDISLDGKIRERKLYKKMQPEIDFGRIKK